MTIGRLINRLLPFATPGTPLLQDVVHLALLCAVLYYAPQLQDAWRQYRPDTQHDDHDTVTADTSTTAQRPAPDATTAAPHNANPQPLAAPQPAPEPAPTPPPALAPPAQPDPDAAAAAPAAATQPRATPQRPIGAKKAASLARRDQRRAYNEFLRSQGEASRAADAVSASEREAERAAERARRADVEASIRARQLLLLRSSGGTATAEEQRVAEARRRTEAVRAVGTELGRRGWVDLAGVAGEYGEGRAWLEGLVRAEGMFKPDKGREVVFVTEGGVLIRVERADVRRCWRVLGDRGEERVAMRAVGELLKTVVEERAAAAAVAAAAG